jgi:hypothetical protein
VLKEVLAAGGGHLIDADDTSTRDSGDGGLPSPGVWRGRWPAADVRATVARPAAESATARH